MRVGFDVSPLVRSFPLGVTRAVSGLVRTLEERGQIEVIRLEPPPGGSLRRWRGGGLIRAVDAENLAGLHSFTSAFAVRGKGLRVQTIHELPWRHGVSENADLRHRLWAGLGPLRADRVLVPTDFVARDLKQRLVSGSKKIRVAPWGIDSRFSLEASDGSIDEVILGRYRLGEAPFLLALGAVRKKKGLARILHGMSTLLAQKKTPPQLVITGPQTQQLRRDLGLASKLGLARFVTTLEEVREEDLPALLRLALAVPVLSFSEGFGLPVLEALASGTPVIVPRATAQAEVAGTSGIVVDADCPQEVARAIGRAEAMTHTEREGLALRAATYSWERAAAAVEDAWLELA